MFFHISVTAGSLVYAGILHGINFLIRFVPSSFVRSRFLRISNFEIPDFCYPDFYRPDMYISYSHIYVQSWFIHFRFISGPFYILVATIIIILFHWSADRYLLRGKGMIDRCIIQHKLLHRKNSFISLICQMLIICFIWKMRTSFMSD